MSAKIAVVLGVGAGEGLGASLCRCAAKAGYFVVVVGQTPSKVDAIVAGLAAEGGRAEAQVVDVTDEAQVVNLFTQVDAMDGALDFVAYNVGNAFVHDSLTMSAEFFERAWRVCCLGGFLAGREAGRRLATRGQGSLIFTGATASIRSRPPYMAFASGKAGLRSVAFALARELGPRGVHVAHVVIDGAIDGERINSRVPELKAKLGDDGMLSPDAIAESYWQLHKQHPTAWTFELDLRPAKEGF